MMVSIDANVRKELSKGSWRSLASGNGPSRIIQATYLGPCLQCDLIILEEDMAAGIQINLRTQVPLHAIVEIAFECYEITLEPPENNEQENLIKFWDANRNCVLDMFQRRDGELCISPLVRLSAS